MTGRIAAAVDSPLPPAAAERVATADDPLLVAYDLTCGDGDDPFQLAREIAVEQTVELPEECIASHVNERVVGRLEELERLDPRRWRALVGYPRAAIGGEVTQLLTVLFGNVSLQHGIRVAEVRWPGWLLELLPGPRFGIDGLRELLPGAAGRALLCAAAKPMGLTAAELATLCGRFARGGVDLVKDDHGLADQPSAPFAERVARCQEAVERANRERGGHTLYVPNLTGPVERLAARLDLLAEHGVRAAMVSPVVTGLDTLRWLAESSGLALVAHPALAGAFFAADHGIAPQLMLGDLFRLLGADGVIYPNAGGRFPFSAPLCQAINQRLRRGIDGIRPAFPVVGGGIDVASVPALVQRYGVDTTFLIGGSLYRQGDVERASRRLVEAIAKAC